MIDFEMIQTPTVVRPGTFEVTLRLSIGGEATYAVIANSKYAAQTKARRRCEDEMGCRASVVRARRRRAR